MRLRILEIGARGEGASSSGEDDGPHGCVGLRLAQPGDQRLAEIGAPGVEPLGPVERDEGDRALLLHQDQGAVGRHITSSSRSEAICVVV